MDKRREAYEEFRNKRKVPESYSKLAKDEFKRSIANGDDTYIAQMDSAMIMGFFTAWDIQQQFIESLKCCGNCGNYVNEFDEEYCNTSDNTGCKYGDLVINDGNGELWVLKTSKSV